MDMKNQPMMEINDCEFEHAHGVIEREMGEKTSSMYGRDSIFLTKENLQALLEGKVLETDICGEYKLLIKLES